MQEHKGSRETFDHITDWVYPDFFFSKKDGWERFGMLGVFGDYVLNSLQGDILEIGVGESSLYLGALAEKYNRKIYHCDISPSKIDNPMTIQGYFKTGRCVLFRDSSDEMFNEIRNIHFAFSFIDGDHRYEQVKKDFDNLLPLTVEDGYIILHDVYPPSKEYLSEHRCGGVYKLRQEIEKRDDVDCITLTRGCAMGVGLLLVRKKNKERAYYNG